MSLLQESFANFLFLKGEGVMESYVNNKLLEFSSHAMFVLELSIVTW